MITRNTWFSTREEHESQPTPLYCNVYITAVTPTTRSVNSSAPPILSSPCEVTELYLYIHHLPGRPIKILQSRAALRLLVVTICCRKSHSRALEHSHGKCSSNEDFPRLCLYSTIFKTPTNSVRSYALLPIPIRKVTKDVKLPRKLQIKDTF